MIESMLSTLLALAPRLQCTRSGRSGLEAPQDMMRKQRRYLLNTKQERLFARKHLKNANLNQADIVLLFTKVLSLRGPRSMVMLAAGLSSHAWASETANMPKQHALSNMSSVADIRCTSCLYGLERFVAAPRNYPLRST